MNSWVLGWAKVFLGLVFQSEHYGPFRGSLAWSSIHPLHPAPGQRFDNKTFLNMYLQISAHWESKTTFGYPSSSRGPQGGNWTPRCCFMCKDTRSWLGTLPQTWDFRSAQSLSNEFSGQDHLFVLLTVSHSDADGYTGISYWDPWRHWVTVYPHPFNEGLILGQQKLEEGLGLVLKPCLLDIHIVSLYSHSPLGNRRWKENRTKQTISALIT